METERNSEGNQEGETMTEKGYRKKARLYRCERILATFDDEGYDEAIEVGFGLGLSFDGIDIILMENGRDVRGS